MIVKKICKENKLSAQESCEKKNECLLDFTLSEEEQESRLFVVSQILTRIGIIESIG